jgi:ribosome modulation factor
VTPYYAGYLAAVASGAYLDGRSVRSRPVCGFRVPSAVQAWAQGVLDACRDRQHEAV